MAYSLTSASALGLDLARSPGGVEAAGVLLLGLLPRQAPDHVPPDDDGPAGLRAGRDRAEALRLLGPSAAVAHAPRTEQVDLTAEESAFGRRLREVLQGLLGIGFGTVEDLLVLARSLPEQPRPAGGVHVRTPAEAALGRALSDGVLAALLRGGPPDSGVLALADRLDAALTPALGRLPAVGRAYGGANEQQVHDLLDAVVAASPAALIAMDAHRATATVWAERMHSASWAVELTGRTGAAAAAQLDLVRCLAGHPLGGEDLMGGLWNHLSAAVQAHVVRDALDEDTWLVLCADLLDALQG